MDSATPMPFGDLLRRHRVATRLTQEALAERSGLAARTISDLERGLSRRPHKDTARLLADALELSAPDRLTFEAAARRLVLAPPREPMERSISPYWSCSPGGPDLPTPATVLIGRDQDVRSVRDLLRRTEVRLCTLTGPGGSGKTRLALEVARELRGAFAQRVYFVDLSLIADPSLVLSSVAQALGVREAENLPPGERLRQTLREAPSLLVLDNFEHVVEAAGPAAELLAACPRLKVLATSRAPLHVRGEHEYPVPPLGVPDPGHLPPVAALPDYPAVALFLERARAVAPGFAISPQNAAAVGAICIRLDGLPLAIELAAARVKTFAPIDLLEQLRRRPDFIGTGARDAPLRHQSLQSVLNWSHDLLKPKESALFRRLAVFVGRWPLDAAQAIAGQSDLAEDALEILSQLVDQSLVVAEEHQGETRYRLLETIRQYASRQLAQAGEMERVRDRHRDWYVGWVERLQPELRRARQVEWMERLEAAHGNLLAALEWSQRSDPGDGVRLAGNLWRFWRRHGYLREGRHWLTVVLARGHSGEGRVPGRDRSAWASCHLGAGVLAYEQGDYEAGRSLLGEALALFEQAGDQVGLVEALGELALQTLLVGGDLGSIRDMLENALRMADTLGDQGALGGVLVNLGRVAAIQRDYKRARTLMDEGIARFRQIGDEASIGPSLWSLGWVALLDGDLEQASTILQEGAEISRRMGNIHSLGVALLGLVTLARAEGNFSRMGALLGECVRALRDVGSLVTPVALSLTGDLAVQRGACARGVRLFATGAPGRGSFGPLVMLGYSIIGAQCAAEVATAKAALGEDGFNRAWAEGQAMTLDQAVAYALGSEKLYPESAEWTLE